MQFTKLAPLAVTLAIAFAQPGLAEQVDSGVLGMLYDHDVPVTMTDGVQLRVNIYRPDKPGRYPVLILMGPYGKDTRMADAPAYKESWAKLLTKYPDLCCSPVRDWSRVQAARWKRTAVAFECCVVTQKRQPSSAKLVETGEEHRTQLCAEIRQGCDLRGDCVRADQYFSRFREPT